MCTTRSRYIYLARKETKFKFNYFYANETNLNLSIFVKNGLDNKFEIQLNFVFFEKLENQTLI